MTISTTNINKSYSGNGSTHSFAYDFPIFADADLTVVVRSAAGTETVKTLNTHYIVTGAGASSGGNVLFKFNTGTSSDAHYSATDYRPASGETVVIRSELANTQTLDLVANDPFPASAFETALDKLVRMVQQHDEELDRSVKLSRTNTMTSTEFTVGATDRANKILAFDSSGEISVTQELGTFKGNSATTTTAAFVQRDIVKSTTTAQLNNIYICVADSAVGDALTDTDHWALLVDAVAAGTSATAAASSASSASTSASTATTKASEASTSAATASTQAGIATAKAVLTAADAVSTAADVVSTNADAATTTADRAQVNTDKGVVAADKATVAADKATVATDKAAAATSASSASTSASTATTKAAEASTSAGNASTSESNAAASAATATTQASLATTQASNAASSLATFQGQYHGAASSDPTSNLDSGDLYFNISTGVKVYTGSAWVDVKPSSSEQTNINTVAGRDTEIGLLGVSGVITNMGVLGTSDAVADMNSLAAISSDITSLAGALEKTYTVTVTNSGSGNIFVLDGGNNPTISLFRGNTYIFDQSDGTNSGHPIAFKDSGGSAYTTGVTTTGTPGSSGAKTIFEVPSTAPSSLLYYCTVHGNTMGNAITVTDSNISLVAGSIANVNLTGGSISNVNSVAAALTNINTTATNLSGVNSFAERYRVGSSDPTSSLDEGDLAYNSTSNLLKYYNGSSWQSISPGIGSVADDSSPQLGGDLDVVTNAIVSSSNRNIAITPNGSGSVVLDGLSYPQADGSAGQFLKTDGSGALSFATVSQPSNATTGAAGLMSAADKTKMDAIEASADVTDATNVAAAGAAMLAGASFTGAVDVDDALVANTVGIDNGSNDWVFSVSSNALIFSYGGTAKAKLDSSGNLTVIGNVTAYGSI